MLIADKPQLAESIWEVAGPRQESVPSRSTYVQDGGSLMFQVKLLRGATFSQIFEDYERYVMSNFGENAEIVFDGGYDKASMKDTVHLRRTNGKVRQEVKFSESMKLTKTCKEFLLNCNNKQRFLQNLTSSLNNSSLKAIQAEGDADVLIIQTALQRSETMPTVLIVEDTDLLILLIAHAESKHNIFFMSQAKVGAKKPKLWDIQHVKTRLGPLLCQHILLRPLFGCDTTLRIHGIGKGTAFTKV